MSKLGLISFSQSQLGTWLITTPRRFILFDLQKWAFLREMSSVPLCKGKRQYLLTLQVSRYCLLPLLSCSVDVREPTISIASVQKTRHIKCWLNIRPTVFWYIVCVGSGSAPDAQQTTGSIGLKNSPSQHRIGLERTPINVLIPGQRRRRRQVICCCSNHLISFRFWLHWNCHSRLMEIILFCNYF